MTYPGAKRYRIQPASAGMFHQTVSGRRFGMGRHVNHDPRSQAYAFPAEAAALSWTFHERHVPIFDQGELGSCEGNAFLGILATGPYWSCWNASQQQAGLALSRYPWNETGAQQMYSDITAEDDIDGQWPPTDTGSDGLSAAKEGVKRGLISGYQHTFSLSAALAALQKFPLLMGTEWTEAMFDPDSYGRIAPHGQVAGGHAWIADEYVPPNSPSHFGPVLSKTDAYVGGTTSWNESFGARGRFYLSSKDFGTLLSTDGDVIIPTPLTAPAPTPSPAPAPSTAPTAQQVADTIRKALTDLGL